MTAFIPRQYDHGILRRELFLGTVESVSATAARVALTEAGRPTGSQFEAGRYGRGEVGELVLIEGQVDLVLARLIEVRVPEVTRRSRDGHVDHADPEAFGVVQFLGNVRADSLRVAAGVASYPRLGDRVYAAPHGFVADIPSLMDHRVPNEIRLDFGSVSGKGEAKVSVRPEKLFGRHCAVLGATGGGKSWTVARLLEEAARHRSKVVLLDATGEYRSFEDRRVVHYHMGTPVEPASGSKPCSMPPTVFQESDFIALFEPSGKVQGPKLREAIRSLRLVQLDPTLGTSDGLLEKKEREKRPITEAMRRLADAIESPATPFNALRLSDQIAHECVADGANGKWGRIDENGLTWCIPIRTRIEAIVRSQAFAPVFSSSDPSFLDATESVLTSDVARILRLDLSGLSYEFHAREFIANAIGRSLLRKARERRFLGMPLIVVVDEAHNFIGRSVGYEEGAVRLDAFEMIAREGRKYGLTICLATQRPRDLTEGVLSQIGTLIVHRLTNDRDREIVERACGEVDRAATAFLANLRQGEAAIIGVDFPIPLTIQVARPRYEPKSDGPDFQSAWGTTGDPVEVTDT